MLQQLYDFITQHDFLQEITNFFQKLKNNWPQIILFFFLIIILYYLWKLASFFFNRQTCIKCDQATRKIWLKINSQLGICYRCIAGRIWEEKDHDFSEELKEIKQANKKLELLISNWKQEK
jgi:hypothetical protein